MASLDHLMELPGAMAAVNFSENGEVSDFRGDLTDDLAGLAGQMCAANMAIFRMQADGWTRLTGQKGFLPEKGFSFIGLDIAVTAMNHQAVFMSKENADFDRAFDVLGG
ncbi:DUF2173 family protein [Thiohalorhabdus sp.]|uniref:DUF2173 family protein n=1 Tax=Thiohalorhabdus sp. TaxID=3094134 RepID=UPI002FC3CC96